MEFGERLVTSSVHMASSSASSSPAPPQTPSTKCSSPARRPAGSSPLTTCGHLLHVKGDECVNLCGHSSGFPLVSHPGFGLYTLSASQHGGLGGVGVSAMAAHSQFATFSEWLRQSEAHNRGGTAFFPPLMGLHPVFASTFKNYDPTHLHPHNSVSVGGTTTMNGRSASSPTGSSALQTSSFPTKVTKNKANSTNSEQSHKSGEDMHQQHRRAIQNITEQKPPKRQLETSSMSSSQSGSMSDSSSDSDGSSSDPDDIEEDNNNDEDEDDQSNDSEDSDSERDGPEKRKVRLTQSTSQSKNKRPSSADGNTTQDSHCDIVPLTSSYHLQSSSHPAGAPHSAALFLQSSRPVEEEGQQHISVIHATGLAAGASSVAVVQSHREDCPLPSRSSPNPIFAHSSSPKHSSVCSSPKPLALCCSSKPLSLCTSPKPPPVFLLTKPQILVPSQKPQHKPKLLMPSPRKDGTKERNASLPDGRALHRSSFKYKQPISSKESVKQVFSAQHTSLNCIDTNLFLNHHQNGESPTMVQDFPLALIKKPRLQSSTLCSKTLPAATSPLYPMPINLNTGIKDMSGSFGSPLKSSAPSGVANISRKTPKSLHTGKSLSKSSSSCPLSDLIRSSESDIHSSKDSDESLDDHDGNDEDNGVLEDEDSGSSLSESESNSGSEDEAKEQGETDADSNAEKTSLKRVKEPPSIHKSSLEISAKSFHPNLPIIKPTSLSSRLFAAPTVTSLGALSNRTILSPPSLFTTMSAPCKQRKITDVRLLRIPFDLGWQRETRLKTVVDRLHVEVAYFAPCGKKLRQHSDILKYLLRNGITEISRDNFSFSPKIQIGVFYEAREGPEGSQWVLLTEEEIPAKIIAMGGRRRRFYKSEKQVMVTGEDPGAGQGKPNPLKIAENSFQDVNDAKALRRLEAQEIARQAAQIKMMKKMEKKAMAQAAKEARKHKAKMAAEERQRKREQMKILKQQEKIKRIQQVRMEKEVRAQQILEARRKKKEEAANAKILETEKRNKEKELRRLQAVTLKRQELERHRLDMERERRRQHMMLMKAMEARKKAQEKERLKKEKSDEKRLNKERKMELKRLELEKAKALNKPNEDMCLADHKSLPDLTWNPCLILPTSTISDCLMVLQFLHSFGKVLQLNINPHMFNMCDLQKGLLNIGDNMGELQDLLVSMLSAAVCDPGIPAGHKNKTLLGDTLTSVEINRDNVSEILQIYMTAHCEHTELAALALSLRTKAFQAHNPTQKTSVLAFLVNELCCSKAVISEIDKNIDHMTNLRKDKIVVERKLRKLKSIHAKKTGKRDSGVRAENSQTSVKSTARQKCKRKEGESEDEDDEEEDTEDQGDEDDDEEEEESGGKKGKKPEICDEEDDNVHSTSAEELERLIEKTYKQQSQIRQKLFDASQLLRSMTIGQDRFRRHYWVLPNCGGIFVEGMESDEGYEEAEKERRRQTTAQVIRIKEEQPEEKKMSVQFGPAESTEGDTATMQSQQDKDSLNLFLQKPGTFSKLSKLLQVDNIAKDSDISSNNCYSARVPVAASSPSNSTCQTTSPQQGLADKTDGLVQSLVRGSPWISCSPQPVLQDDQLSKIITEKSNQWFSLFPRSPCDESSVTSDSSAPASLSPLQIITPKSPSSISPNSPGAASSSPLPGIGSMSLVQQGTYGVHQSRLTLCDMSRTASSPSLPSSSTTLPPEWDLASQHADSNKNRVFSLASNNPVHMNVTPEPLSDKPACASIPAGEVAMIQDYPSPQPIPKEMLCGWWRVSDMLALQDVVKALHGRGIRERVLQKQIQKHMGYMNQLFPNSKDAEQKKQEVSQEIIENWCIEEQAMEVDISMLQQVEVLERKIISARLQVKGWMHPEPESARDDMVYHEHKFSSPAAPEKTTERKNGQEEVPGALVRQPNNPLDIAVVRLAELERNIERSEDEAAPGVKLWHKALGEVRSSAQLSLCMQQLLKTITWERSVVKVHCQLCQKGENEDLLLLCDACDKGIHTYCHRPKITTVPDGGWLCPACVAKESGQSLRTRRQLSRTAGGGKKCIELKRNAKPSALGELIQEEAANSKCVPKKGTKEPKKRKGDSPPITQTRHDSPVSCEKKARLAQDSTTKGLATCRVLLAELETHQDAWPFLKPVDHKAVPGYRKIIKKPMDFSTIREKLITNQYSNWESFIADVNLIFENCERFNEDDSEIGQAGHSMQIFFDKRWAELQK